jgi:hypothetical protein
MECKQIEMTWHELEQIRHSFSKDEKWGQAKMACLMGYTLDGYRGLRQKTREFIPEQAAASALFIKVAVESGMSYKDIAALRVGR